jgi:hypothetical protein
MQEDTHVADVDFVDGVRRPVYQDLQGRLYVINGAAGPVLRRLVHPA